MPVKCDMIIRHIGQSLGWIETWYLDQSSIDTSAKSALRNIAGTRLTFLHPSAKIEFLRWSTNSPPTTPPPNVRRQRISEIELYDRFGSAGGKISTDDPAWTATKVRFNGTVSGVFATRNMRAMPAILFSGGQPNKVGQFMQPVIDQYVVKLQANGAKIRHILRGPPKRASYVDVRDAQVLGITHRDTGRPLYLPRGRKPKKKIEP